MIKSIKYKHGVTNVLYSAPCIVISFGYTGAGEQQLVLDEQAALEEFEEAFHLAGKPFKFTRAGIKAIFEIIADREAEAGEPVLIDPVGCCDEYEEFESMEHLTAQHPSIQSESDIMAVYKTTETGGYVCRYL